MIVDCLFINPDSSVQAYQGLSEKYSAIEPPTWALLLAESCRSKGFTVKILDCIAENLSIDQSLTRINSIKPRVIVFVVYGQNPNAGTTSMIGATILAEHIKNRFADIHISFVGSHVSALPRSVLELNYVDSVLINEGVYSLHSLLSSDLGNQLYKVKGIGWKSNNTIHINSPESPVPQERLDEDLPGYAWDLLPYINKPLDLYRSHVWHADFNESLRSPYAAIYTSLGCVYGCEFCMINIINRTDYTEGISAADSRIMRFWSVHWVKRQFQILGDLGVTTIRISDEMFLLNHNYYLPICEGLSTMPFKFHIWVYSRVDTIRQKYLHLIKKSGINWIALGIEAGNQSVRQESSKGSFDDINVRDICKQIRSHSISIIANYIVGLPEDNYHTMITTLNLALELNTEMMNVYPCQALPGSSLYTKALAQGIDLPKQYEEFAFLSYASTPLATKYLSSRQVIEFRDYFWRTYFANPAFLELVRSKFGQAQYENVQAMSCIKLNRKLLGD